MTPLVEPLDEPDGQRRASAEDAAARAWRGLGRAPRRVERLKRSRAEVFRLAGAGPDGADVIAKHGRRAAVAAEQRVYAGVLPRLPLQHLACLGLVADADDAARAWLFVEDAGGAAYDEEDAAHRVLAGTWLATLHAEAARVGAATALPERDGDSLRHVLYAARERIERTLAGGVIGTDAGARGTLEALRRELEEVEIRWERIAVMARKLPETLIHGDFHPKNLRVRDGRGGRVLVVFDWEDSGRGSPIADLAAFRHARPLADLGAYAEVQRRWRPKVDRETLGHLVSLGRILWLLGVVRGGVEAIAPGFVAGPAAKLAVYRDWLAEALAELPWELGRAQAWLAHLPDRDRLAAALPGALLASGRAARDVRLLGRTDAVYASSAPSEIVTVAIDGGEPVRLVAKYPPHHGGPAWGHRGATAREAVAYRDVLGPLAVTHPAFYGSLVEAATGETWLFIEYLDGSAQLEKAPDREAIVKAARWIGRFHAAAERRMREGWVPPLPAYDRAYYMGWARRTLEFAEPDRVRFPWLARLCAGFAREARRLAAVRPTVIHGEYYPHNVLWRKGEVHPVDWEAAAVGAGEIDVAALPEGWGDAVEKTCAEAYAQARWPEGAPAGYLRRLDAARVYLQLRWLGDRPAWTQREESLPRFEELERLGARLGLL